MGFPNEQILFCNFCYSEVKSNKLFLIAPCLHISCVGCCQDRNYCEICKKQAFYADLTMEIKDKLTRNAQDVFEGPFSIINFQLRNSSIIISKLNRKLEVYRQALKDAKQIITQMRHENPKRIPFADKSNSTMISKAFDFSMYESTTAFPNKNEKTTNKNEKTTRWKKKKK